MSINKSLAKSTLVIFSLTLLAKPFGIFKEIYVASQFGTGKELDAFYIAFTIPAFICGILSECLRSSFIPVYFDYKTKVGKREADILFSTMLNLNIVVMLALTVCILLLSNLLIKLVAPGFDLGTRQLSTKLSTFLFPIVFFLGINNFLSAEVNAHKRFVATTLLPVLVPISMILFLYFGQKYGIYSLALGHIAGLILAGIGLIFVLRNTGVHYTMKIVYDHPGLRKTLKLMVPLLVGAMLAGTNTIVDRIMASTLPAGSISSLGYADRIIKIFQSVIIMAISTAALPYLSEQVSRNEMAELKNTIILTIKFLAFLFIPITLGLLILSKPLVSLLFQRGQFGADSTLLTSQALTFYSLGLLFMALVFVFSRVFHAIQDTKVNMYAAFLSVSLNIVLNFILMRYMGSPGIALSTSIVYFVVTLFLSCMLFVRLGDFEILHSFKAILHILAPATVMSVACLFTLHFLEARLLLKVTAVTVVGFLSYVGFSCLFKVPELTKGMKLIKAISFEFGDGKQKP